MRIAVLGVGLIGGSIGLAARQRVEDAVVVGWDPDADLLARAVELGAIDERAETLADAVADAGVIFCAAPVGDLPGLATEALSAAGADAAVTDVGSIKGGAVAALGEDPRFVGGHPLAGAETSGVDNARADLFDGARWYLTPTPLTGGVVYDRVQRIVTEIGARPQAIDAAEHDRLMATVSHLPHVLANVLVEQAAESLRAGDDGRLPEIGPSFRDATRVAGANPAIWGDIFGGNREVLADEVEAVAGRLSDAAKLIREADAAGLEGWQRDARRRPARAARGRPRRRPAGRAAPDRPQQARDRRRARARARARGCQHRGHGAPSRRRHEDRRRLALRRGRRRGRPRGGAGE